MPIKKPPSYTHTSPYPSNTLTFYRTTISQKSLASSWLFSFYSLFFPPSYKSMSFLLFHDYSPYIYPRLQNTFPHTNLSQIHQPPISPLSQVNRYRVFEMR